jgi:hypothetical protein
MASFTVDNGTCQGVARLGLHVLVGNVIKLYANSYSDSELPSLDWPLSSSFRTFGFLYIIYQLTLLLTAPSAFLSQMMPLGCNTGTRLSPVGRDTLKLCTEMGEPSRGTF